MGIVTGSDGTAGVRRHRSTRLRAAVVTGGVAKALAVATQLVAIGIAARALRSDELGTYLVMASVVAWLGLAAVGVGPGLTQRIAVANANGDVAGEATAFSSSIALAGLFVVIVSGAVLIVATAATSGGTMQSVVTDDVRTAALILGLATATQVWLSIFEAAQLGHQEQYVANAFYALGLACTLVILLLIGSALATVTAFVGATVVPPLLARIGNAGLYVARRRYLLTRRISMRAARGVLSTSVAFAALSLGSVASQQIGFLWLAHSAGPAATISLGVMFRLNTAAYGVVALVTQPFWPAVADAVARHDSAWARRAYRRASWLTVTFALAYGAGLVTVGPLFIDLWTGAHVVVPPALMLLFAIYFVVGVWAHVNAITLVGLGRVWSAALVLIVEAGLSSGGAILLIGTLGATGVIVALLIATTAISAILLPLLVRRSWLRLEGSLDRAFSNGAVASP
jgi:O-antigen/teichoic acid export membrane protein